MVDSFAFIEDKLLLESGAKNMIHPMLSCIYMTLPNCLNAETPQKSHACPVSETMVSEAYARSSVSI